MLCVGVHVLCGVFLYGKCRSYLASVSALHPKVGVVQPARDNVGM